jgi:hypothetical protein
MNMSEHKSDHPESDPFAPLVQFTDRWMKTWSSVMSDVVASESFADAMGEQLEGMLEATKLVRQQMKVSMEQTLQQMNMPTRDQILGLAERMTNIEMRLDDLDAKLDESLDYLRTIQAALESNE